MKEPMPLILTIDTSTENASISLAAGRTNLHEATNDTQKDHASWLHVGIRQLLHDAGATPADLRAVAVTAGPGSYTGLRVGLSAAKGLCYALGIPLITVNTLEAMSSATRDQSVDYLCPMIDARRMEVFTALYDNTLQPILKPCAMILDETSFSHFLSSKKILFFGNGQNKFAQLVSHNNAYFKTSTFKTTDYVELIYNKFLLFDFTELAYSEPVYLKEHYTLYPGKS